MFNFYTTSLADCRTQAERWKYEDDERQAEIERLQEFQWLIELASSDILDFGEEPDFYLKEAIDLGFDEDEFWDGLAGYGIEKPL